MPAGSPARGRRTPAGRLQRGFTLLEMAIVLTIVGLIIGMVAPLLGQVMESNRAASTNAHLDAIQDAIVVFVRANGRIPCPAQPDDTPLGEENATCTGNNDDGIVPFRTLGLAEDVARDGYEGYITYHVAEDYAAGALNGTPITDPAGFCSETATLTIDDSNGDDMAPGQEVVYFLVSHGENGYGRYNPPSANQVNPNGGGTFEDENADDDDTAVSTSTIAEGATDGPYDDTVRWSTRDLIADEVQEFGCAP